MSEPTLTVKLTQSQHMALCDILIEHLLCKNHTQVYINCSTNPPTETPYEDILLLFIETNAWDHLDSKLREAAALGGTKLAATGGAIPE